MTVFDISNSLSALASKQTSFGRLTFTAKPPLLLSNGPGQTLPLWKLFGVYFIVEKDLECWNRPLDEFTGELLYIGQTATNVHERIKSHFGLANMQSTFENHRWRTVKRVPGNLQERLALGDIVLYCVEVTSDLQDLLKERQALLPEVVEKQLLLDFAFATGSLPILNLQF